ncbi:MAG: type IV pilus twitching motility protein PilT [Pseudomonadota bacterium]
MSEFLDIFRYAGKINASDVLIIANSPPVYRVNGDLTPANMSVLSAEQTKKYLYSLIDEDKIKKFEKTKELDFSFSVDDKFRFRVNYYWQRETVSAAFRLIPYAIPSFEDLGIPEIAKNLTKFQHGLVLVTGPTGHGKSTTQACLINHINLNRKKHIITIEDPIEYIHKNINSFIEQREVLQDTLTFANGLKYALRQNPDVLLVGEMRDLETISSALTAAETGHLVFATLHTNDATQSITRIIDVFPQSQQKQITIQLAFTLKAVLSQRLIPGIDKRRYLASEVLIQTPALSNMIREQKLTQVFSMIETQGALGMHTMDSSILELVKNKKITKNTAQLYLKKQDTDI